MEVKKMLSLKDRDWESFFIENIATIESGCDIYESERRKGFTPYISSTSVNNGVVHFVDNNNSTRESGCISVNRNGSVGYAFYHPYDALFSNDCRKLRLNHPSKYVGIFVAHQVTVQREKYSYGYKMGTGRLRRQSILLPVSKPRTPDWNFMDDYIREREYFIIKNYIGYAKKVTKEICISNIDTLKQKEWREFNVLTYFTPRRGRESNMSSLTNGNTALISAKKINNGLKSFVSVPDERVHLGHTITLNNDGDGGAGLAYYQPFSFALDTHVTSLRPNIEMSKYTLMFVASAITKQGERYGHGHSISDTRLKKIKIMLPVKHDELPDWEYMDKFAKQAVHQKLFLYLQYAEKYLGVH